MVFQSKMVTILMILASYLNSFQHK